MADPVVLSKNMLSVHLSIIKFVCMNPCVVNARFVPWTFSLTVKARRLTMVCF